MKKKSSSKKSKKVVMVSGGFDPVHIGHVRLFEEAKKLGDELIVVINNDNWKKFKGRDIFMPDRERKEIIEAFACVDKVILTKHIKNTKDGSVCVELRRIRPYIFANGGDRNKKDAQNPKSFLYKDINLCKKLGIKIVYNVGKGGKIRSSSELLKEYSRKNKK